MNRGPESSVAGKSISAGSSMGTTIPTRMIVADNVSLCPAHILPQGDRPFLDCSARRRVAAIPRFVTRSADMLLPVTERPAYTWLPPASDVPGSISAAA